MRNGFLLFVATMLCHAVSMSDSSPEKTTLLIYDTLAKPFSAVNEIEPILIALTRFEGRVYKKEAAHVTQADIEKAYRIILVGVSGIPKSEPSCQRLIEKTDKPVMGVGHAANFGQGSDIKSIPADKAVVQYRNSKWTVRLDPFFPQAPKGAQVLAEAGTGSGKKILAWRDRNRFGFGALPDNPPLSMIFSDILLDFFGVKATAGGLFFVLEDYHPGSDPSTLRRLSDYFAFQQTPFIVTTQMRDVPADVTQLMLRDTFLDSLRYAQMHGAKIFLRGDIGSQDVENYKIDGIEVLGAEVRNVGWPAPFLEPSAFHFVLGSWSYQPIPGGENTTFRSHSLLNLSNDAVLLPLNVPGGMDGEADEYVQKTIREMASLRGSMAGVVIPAWLPFQKMRDLIDGARSAGMKVIDPLNTPSTSPEKETNP